MRIWRDMKSRRIKTFDEEQTSHMKQALTEYPDDLQKVYGRYRALQHAADRGTGMDEFEKLEELFKVNQHMKEGGRISPLCLETPQ